MSIAGKTFRRTVSPLIPGSWKRRVKGALFDVPDTENSLRRMKKLGFAPRTVIDVGAYVGDWTRTCKQLFPEARVLMVEPQVAKASALAQVAADLRDVEARSVLLGATEGANVDFYEAESGSSVLRESAQPRPPTGQLAMSTLDAITADGPFARPDFIKLDVQGYELQVLKGGEHTLRSAEAVLMEVNLLALHEGVPLFHQAAEFMGKRGFQVYDLCSFIRRPYDGALWQVDVVFIGSSSHLVSSSRWC